MGICNRALPRWGNTLVAQGKRSRLLFKSVHRINWDRATPGWIKDTREPGAITRIIEIQPFFAPRGQKDETEMAGWGENEGMKDEGMKEFSSQPEMTEKMKQRWWDEEIMRKTTRRWSNPVPYF